jgi:pilus assembly protein CpaB
MRLTRKTAVTIAIVCGLCAAILAYVSYRTVQSKPATKPKVTVPVVVSTTDIPRRKLITSDMVKLVRVDQEQRPPGSLSSLDEVVNHVSAAPIAAQQPIAASQVERQRGAGLAYAVPTGMRAVAVAIDAVAGVAGFLKPGDHVDVLATFDWQQGAITRTVLQDVQLLAIDDRTVYAESAEGGAANAEAKKGEEAKAKVSATVTLAVAPAQAQSLTLAASKATIRLALRPPEDHALLPLPASDSLVLMGVPSGPAASASPEGPKAAPAAAAPASPPAAASQPAGAPGAGKPSRDQSVEVIRGSETQLVVP